MGLLLLLQALLMYHRLLLCHLHEMLRFPATLFDLMLLLLLLL